MSDPQIDPFDVTVQFDPIMEVGLAAPPADDLNLILEISVGHRNAAEAEGFSPEAAEAMAVSLHSGLIAAYFTS